MLSARRVLQLFVVVFLLMFAVPLAVGIVLVMVQAFGGLYTSLAFGFYFIIAAWWVFGRRTASTLREGEGRDPFRASAGGLL